jgi:hypothetical protein
MTPSPDQTNRVVPIRRDERARVTVVVTDDHPVVRRGLRTSQQYYAAWGRSVGRRPHSGGPRRQGVNRTGGGTILSAEAPKGPS